MDDPRLGKDIATDEAVVDAFSTARPRSRRMYRLLRVLRPNADRA